MRTVVNGVYVMVPLPATEWLREKIIACKRLEELDPSRGSYFFRKSPLYNNSSLIPLAITVTNIHGAQAITLSKLMFWPWNMDVAKGIETAAKTEKPASPIIRPSLMFPFFIKIDDKLPPEIEVNTIIGIMTRMVLVNIARAILLIGEV